jgi:hypothetical protein
MTDDENLRAINLAINDAENSGDCNYLNGVLAPELAFMRADRETIDDRKLYLSKVPDKTLPKRSLKIEKIEVLGNRAIVKCIVTQGDQRFHNLRLFVRLEDQWKLLGWANEPQV